MIRCASRGSHPAPLSTSHLPITALLSCMVQDIYIQRWRMEDLPWRVEIGDWVEVWNATAGVFYLVNATSGEISNLTIATPKDLATMHALALDAHTYRNITGQVRHGFVEEAEV
jgi:hypothetical protein